MPQFRTKPVMIEASQWFPGVSIDGVEEAGMAAYIDTRDGRAALSPGDWVIHGENGARHHCTPEVFAASYEPVPT